MRKKKISSGNCLGVTIGLILLIVGLVITFTIPVLGWVVGPLLCILGLFMGGKSQKVWRCVRCRAYVPRA